MVICLERDADLHMAQLMPLPLTVPCFSKIQIGFTFLVPAHLGSPGQRAVKRVCACVCALAGQEQFGGGNFHTNKDAGGMWCRDHSHRGLPRFIAPVVFVRSQV